MADDLEVFMTSYKPPGTNEKSSLKHIPYQRSKNT